MLSLFQSFKEYQAALLGAKPIYEPSLAAPVRAFSLFCRPLHLALHLTFNDIKTQLIENPSWEAYLYQTLNGFLEHVIQWISPAKVFETKISLF